MKNRILAGVLIVGWWLVTSYGLLDYYDWHWKATSLTEVLIGSTLTGVLYYGLYLILTGTKEKNKTHDPI